MSSWLNILQSLITFSFKKLGQQPSNAITVQLLCFLDRRSFVFTASVAFHCFNCNNFCFCGCFVAKEFWFVFVNCGAVLSEVLTGYREVSILYISVHFWNVLVWRIWPRDQLSRYLECVLCTFVLLLKACNDVEFVMIVLILK